MARSLVVLSALAWLATIASAENPAVRDAAQRPNFASDVAEIVNSNCVACHHPDGPAPFPLLSYEDVRSRGKEVLAAVTSGHMPPWSASTPSGFPALRDDPRLTPRQIATLSRWIASGMPAGELTRAPLPPPLPAGWSLGVPDLMLALPRPMSIPPDTTSRLFNIVLYMNHPTDRWIRAIDYRPTARQILSHAIVFAVPATTRVDEEDALPGFGGLTGTGAPSRITDELLAANRSVEILGVWTPGVLPRLLPDGLAIRLPKGSNIVLQFHARAADTGAIEDGHVAIYFSKSPAVRLTSLETPPAFGFAAGIDLPPGSATVAFKDEFALPIDVTVFGARGHGHDRARDMKLTAALPDGSVQPLLWIDRWNADHQQTYYFVSPVRLPKGTIVRVAITYESDPARRILWGPRLADEIGSMGLVIADPNATDAAMLADARSRHFRAQLLRSAR